MLPRATGASDDDVNNNDIDFGAHTESNDVGDIATEMLPESLDDVFTIQFPTELGMRTDFSLDSELSKANEISWQDVGDVDNTKATIGC